MIVVDVPPEVMVALARARLGRGEPLTLRAEGGSMWPLLLDGDTVEVQPLGGPPALGDIVLFELRGRLALHRVVAIDGDRVVLKGDALTEPDGSYPAAALLGRLDVAWPRFHRAVAVGSRVAGPVAGRLLSRARRLLSRPDSR